MVGKIDKLKDLDYNELIALSVIEKDKDLNEMFSDIVKSPFSLVISLSKEDKLSTETKQLIRNLFDKIILSKPMLIDWYLRALDNKEIIIKPTKEKALPRRYGKALIVKDIAKQGGKATNAQLTALALNSLKNIYVNLNTRLIHDMLGDKQRLTDIDYREIRATIQIVENKLKPILKKK